MIDHEILVEPMPGRQYPNPYAAVCRRLRCLLRGHQLTFLLVVSLSTSGTICFADELSDSLDSIEENHRIEQVTVIGTRKTIPGSGVIIDVEELKRFDYSDLNQVIAAVPGVYVREEDGYGLRPNIGIRGAAAERSLKITLMEDGVLIAPAPYSAPAAYYVPNINRISGVEVLKGPSAIQTGPHTVGGAINFVTREVPNEQLKELDLSYGTDAFYKGAIAIGGPVEDSNFSFLFEGLSYGTDGFKTLDSGGDTGFVRSDLDLKLRWLPADRRDQRLTIKVAFANEDADETYLGLTDDDFRAEPTRRYSASQLARFQSDHANVHVNYGLALGAVYVNTKTYWNRFERSWNKLDGFIHGRALQTILNSPHRFTREYNLLIGLTDSSATDAQTLEITNNDRAFTSMGLQTTVARSDTFGSINHDLTVGLRLHKDEVWRDHQPKGHLVTQGVLVWDGFDRARKSWNNAESAAIAAFASEELAWRDLSLTLGLRYETIDGEFQDLNLGVTRRNNQSVVSPGIGLYWQVADPIGLLAGVYRGFSPAGPGVAGVDPERSLNLEAGMRIQHLASEFEAIVFVSDYDNLLGRCRVSDTGCEAGQEFNGGEVAIHGVELNAEWSVELPRGMRMDTGIVYTFTDASFETGFLSGFPQWGLVRENDELPYLPRHRGRAHVRLAADAWEFSAAAKYQASMREEPGVGTIEDGLHTDAYTTVDLTTSWNIRESTMLQLIVGNAMNDAAIVSHRPFGARPNRPRWISLRVRNRF